MILAPPNNVTAPKMAGFRPKMSLNFAQMGPLAETARR
jgi:hypothetical protein